MKNIRKIMSQVALFILVISTLSACSGARNLKTEEAKKEFENAGVASAVEGAKMVASALEKAVDEKQISLEDLFDENYVLIKDSYPQKFVTKFDVFLDKSIQVLEDRILQRDVRAEYAIAVDRNGYLPTHNSKYSKPLTGNYDVDLANSRGKRFFNDKIGLAAARNEGQVLAQYYRRDNGQRMTDFAAPISVKGRCWGAFRVGMRRDSDF